MPSPHPGMLVFIQTSIRQTMRVSQKRQRRDLSRPLLLLLLCWWKVFHRIIDDAQRHYTRKRPSLSLMLFDPSSRRGPAPPRQPSRLCYLCRTRIFTDTCAMMHREALLIPHAEAERQEVKSTTKHLNRLLWKNTLDRKSLQQAVHCLFCPPRPDY